MKIVKASNFDREMYTEKLIQVPVYDRQRGEEIIRVLNKCCSGPDCEDYYKLVDDDYQLKVFEP